MNTLTSRSSLKTIRWAVIAISREVVEEATTVRITGVAMEATASIVKLTMVTIAIMSLLSQIRQQLISCLTTLEGNLASVVRGSSFLQPEEEREETMDPGLEASLEASIQADLFNSIW